MERGAHNALVVGSTPTWPILLYLGNAMKHCEDHKAMFREDTLV